MAGSSGSRSSLFVALKAISIFILTIFALLGLAVLVMAAGSVVPVLRVSFLT